MISRLTWVLLSSLILVCASWPLAAQTTAGLPSGASDILKSSQWTFEIVTPTHFRFTGQVEQEFEAGKFFADEVNYYSDTGLVVAAGNVVFANPEGRISAERIEFDLRRRTGTFHQASGILSLGQIADRAQFGNQDPDVYFYGETIEKLSGRKYRITRGGFTTCVQPTPRWELTSSSVVLNLDEYAIGRNTVLRVKGVPMMYLPVIYYPIQEDERATGFLMPTYGTSTFRGQSISNAFFWAIGRSHDATFFHDWFTRTGQGVGSEYRYVAGPGSDGAIKAYWLNQREAEFGSGAGARVLPAERSFELTGGATHVIARGLRARARFDHFSNVTLKQLYHASVGRAAERRRSIGGSLNWTAGVYDVSSVYQRIEAFGNEKGSVVYGSSPRVTATLSPRRLFGTPIYAGATQEYGYLVYRDTTGDAPRDASLTRLDVMPTIRVPLSTWPFLTVNTAGTYRVTYYSESRDEAGRHVQTPLTRRYASVRSDIIGPVFTKIWDAPNSRWAERFKHVIEPQVGVEHFTAIDNYRRVETLTDSSDFIVGGTTRVRYGLTNRWLARTRGTETAPGQAREFLSVTIDQSYYANSEASQYDTDYSSSIPGRRLTNVSPVALTARATPTLATSADLRIEYDATGDGLQSVSLNATGMIGAQTFGATFSRLSREKPANTYLTANTGLTFMQRRIGGSYSLSWDIGRGYVVSQSMVGFYNAQCCGFSVEYQNYNFQQTSAPISSDRRMNFSFTLAGLGTFSNFFGAFGGQR
jgi:LPS-assembly protein